MLIVRDLNLHSPSWSPTGWDTSRHVHRLKEWMASQTFDLLTKPHIPMWMGEGEGRNSTIDLVWSNMAALIQGIFIGAEVDFRGSLGLDHALIRTIVSTPIPIHRAKQDRTNRFDSDINAEAWEEWDHILWFKLPPTTPYGTRNRWTTGLMTFIGPSMRHARPQ
jgi:hypothetical protein